MKTADWTSILDANILIIGESSNLQWKDEIIQYAMFMDYYFNHQPYDLGERSRHSEALTLFEYIKDMSGDYYRAEKVYGTLLTNDILARPPKGKHLLIPEKCAVEGISHIKDILNNNKSIKYIFVIGMQANYYLQKLRFYSSGQQEKLFIKGAEPRRIGINAVEQYYQPVDAKPFRDICYKIYDVNNCNGIKIIPILPIKSYPLNENNIKNFGENYEKLKGSIK